MSGGKRKVLIIDDEEAIRFLLKTYLENSGFQVVEASNGQDALNKIDNSFSAQIVDINMPVMDGLTYLRELKKKGELNIPTLVVTGYLDEVEYPVLRKPFQKQVLLDTLIGLMH